MRWPRLTVPPRVAMFVIGAGGFYHEVWLTTPTAPERPWILAIAGALMGLPFFFTSPGGPSGGGQSSRSRPAARWDDEHWDDDRDDRRRRIGDGGIERRGRQRPEDR